MKSINGILSIRIIIKNTRYFLFSAVLAGFLFVLNACSGRNKNETAFVISDTTYFSVIQYTLDQMQTYQGQPFAIEEISIINNQTDSALINSYTLDWGAIFHDFFATDISNPKYLDQYKFSMFENNMNDMTVNCMSYEALDPKLTTQKLNINVDPVNNRILSIYIEAQQSTIWTTVEQKLFYNVNKCILIQENKKPFIGKETDKKILYNFLK